MRGVTVGGTECEPERPAEGVLGAGRAGVLPSTRRGAGIDVNATLRAAWEQRHHRHRTYELPAGALFSGRRR